MSNTVFTTIVIAGVESLASTPMYDQMQEKLLRTVLDNPRYQTTEEVTVHKVKFSTLPEERKASIEPFVWSIQQKLGKRGGAWQSDFYNLMGFDFMVLYLE